MIEHSTDRDPGLRPHLRARTAIAVAGICVLLLAGLYGFLTAFFQNRLATETPQRAQFYARTIDDALKRLEHLPYVLSIDPRVRSVLDRGEGRALDPVLREVAGRSGAEFVFVMDPTGKTLSASNAGTPLSLVGNSYDFRPYFQDAMQGRFGHFYAVGTTTGQPGYFMAEPVRTRSGAIVGVVVVKVGLDALSRAWRDSGDLILVTGPRGVVLAASREDLLFGVTRPLGAEDRAELRRRRQFGEADLVRLDWVPEGQSRVRLDGTGYIHSTAALATEPWTLHLLTDVWEARILALLWVALIASGGLMTVVAASQIRSRRLRQALARSQADRERLALEIAERMATEARLQETQGELAAKTRLAALGQLSASITHELGQPISAMRNYIAAEEIATGAIPGQLAPELSSIIDRMQRIVDQLRHFGRPPSDPPYPFEIDPSISAALGLLSHQIRSSGIDLSRDGETDLVAIGWSDRFEQVLVNLARNAIDALEGHENGRLRVRVTSSADAISVEIADNGPGLGGLSLADLKEPFFSTKPSGKGMGLGLAISAQIALEMGGRLEAGPSDLGGAAFRLILKKPETRDEP